MGYIFRLFILLMLFMSSTWTVQVSAQGQTRGFPHLEAIWQKRQISVCFEDYDSVSNRNRRLIRKIANRWSEASRVKFVGWERCVRDSDIRIELVRGGLRSHVIGLGRGISTIQRGMRLAIYENQNYGSTRCDASDRNFEVCNAHSILHEFGHALGFAHEHLRPDTPGTCLRDKIGTPGTALSGPWDASSVMNYCANRPIELSKGDREMVARYYGEADVITPSRFDELPYFSADFYLRTNPDLVQAFGRYGYESARAHWLANGKREGRTSSPVLSLRQYVDLNDDVMKRCGRDYLCAFQHYRDHGQHEGRYASVVFHPSHYRSLGGHHVRQQVGTWNTRGFAMRWLERGINEGQPGTFGVHVKTLRKRGPYGLESYAEALASFQREGGNRAGELSPILNTAYYLNRQPHVRHQYAGGAHYSALVDFHKYGVASGKQGSTTYDPQEYYRRNRWFIQVHGHNNFLAYVTRWYVAQGIVSP